MARDAEIRAGLALSGNTETSGQGAAQPVADVPRPQPTDPDGTSSGGWVKVSGDGPGGWMAADDAAGANSAGWQQT